MQPSPDQPAAVPGFADAHAHLLKQAAGSELAVTSTVVRSFHQQVAADHATPMDVPDPAPATSAPELAGRLAAGLARAAAAGLVEITEMGMRDWRYLDALAALQEAGRLPLRVRVYLASGLTTEADLSSLAARRTAAAGPWVTVEGVKFYADGWLGPRTCAVCREFADTSEDGLLFLDGPTLARRIAPLAQAGWRIATHAIGDRAVAAVLDGYELAWDGDRAAMAAARPRIEHASLLSAELVARMADTGVTACIQPSFAVTDDPQLDPALGPERAELAYPWAALAAAGVSIVAGSDYPVETLDPLAGLARLIRGRSDRPGFGSPATAPPRSRLNPGIAFSVMTDAAAGRTLLSADPRAVPTGAIDEIKVLGTEPAAFS